MWRILLFLLFTSVAFAQNKTPTPELASSGSTTSVKNGDDLSGKWTYRSFINTATLVDGDPQKALSLIFGEGVFTFNVVHSRVTGTFDMGSGYVLDLQGKVFPTSHGVPITVEISGIGRPNTPTAGWEYDYHGYVAYEWPNGVGQVPALVGSVLRAKPHDGAPAGLSRHLSLSDNNPNLNSSSSFNGGLHA
jgi:hypothetical protein